MTESDHARVLIPPPLLYLVVLVLGYLSQRFMPIPMVQGPVVVACGIALVAAGLALGLWGVIHMWRANTAIPPHRPTSAIVADGPFRFTRNPLYLGVNLITAGIGVAAAIPWVLIWQVPAFFVLHHGVVRREEAYLRNKFGTAYTDYQARTRRWL